MIPQHEVKIDPLQIGARPRKAALVPSGVMTRELLRCLRKAEGKPRYTSEIAMHVTRAAGLDMTKISARPRGRQRGGSGAGEGW